MNGRTIFLLLVIAFFERACFFATRARLWQYLSDTETGGLGLSSERTAELLGTLSEWITYAPAAGALLACFVSLRLLLQLGCAIGMMAAASLTWTSTVEVPIRMMIVGHGLFLPALYLLAAKQFSARDAERRYAAFALVMLSVNLGAFGGSLMAGWLFSHVGWEAIFMASALLGLASLATTAFVPSQSAPDAGPNKTSMSGAMILAGCLALGFLAQTYSDDSPRMTNSHLEMLFTTSAMLLWPIVAAVAWSRRARRGALPDVAGKLALAAAALTLALTFSAMGNEPVALPIAESICFGFYDTWVTPVALALAATLFSGRMAALGLGAWLLIEPGALQWTPLIADELYPSPWMGAVCALAAVGIILVLRARARRTVSGD